MLASSRVRACEPKASGRKEGRGEGARRERERWWRRKG